MVKFTSIALSALAVSSAVALPLANNGEYSKRNTGELDIRAIGALFDRAETTSVIDVVNSLVSLFAQSNTDLQNIIASITNDPSQDNIYGALVSYIFDFQTTISSLLSVFDSWDALPEWIRTPFKNFVDNTLNSDITNIGVEILNFITDVNSLNVTADLVNSYIDARNLLAEAINKSPSDLNIDWSKLFGPLNQLITALQAALQKQSSS